MALLIDLGVVVHLRAKTTNLIRASKVGLTDGQVSIAHVASLIRFYDGCNLVDRLLLL